MNNPAPDRKKLLRRAWGHLLHRALWKNKRRAAIVFGLGLLTMIVQLGGILAIIGAARAWDQGGTLSLLGQDYRLWDAQGGLSPLFIAGAIGFILAGVGLGLYNRIIVTRIGRRFFEEKLIATRALLGERISTGQPYDRGQALAFLSRDCRFLAVSYTRILMLLQPALLLLAIFIVTAFLQPLAAAIMFGLGLIILPFHFWLLGWAQRSSDDITDNAKIKSKEEQAFIDYIAQSPIALKPENVPGFQGGAGQDGFLTAFVKRQRLSAFSQSITDIMSLGIIIVFALILLLWPPARPLISAGSLVLLFILWRFLSSYAASLAQAVTMVSSYEPFFRGLLDYEIQAQNGDAGAANPAARSPASSAAAAPVQPLKIDGEITRPVRVALFQKQPISWQLAAPLTGAIGTNVKFISHDFALRAEDIPGEILSHDLLDAPMRGEIENFMANPEAPLSARTKLALSLALSDAGERDVLLLDGTAFTQLAANDLRALLKGLGQQGLVLAFRGLPNRLPLPPRFQIGAIGQNLLSLIGLAHEFQDKRSALLALMTAQSPETPDGFDTAIDSFGEDV